MANLHVVFDESGTGRNNDYVVFAGFIAEAEAWHPFSIAWNKALPNGIDHWHTSDANGRMKQFEQFRDADTQLEQLALSLTDLICKHAASGYGSTITMDDVRALPTKRHRDPYYYAFEQGVRDLARAPGIGDQDIISLICDDSTNYSSETFHVYRSLKDRHPDMRFRFRGICFQDDKTFPPLQAADLYAFCLRQRAENTLTPIWANVLDRIDATFSDQTRGEVTA